MAIDSIAVTASRLTDGVFSLGLVTKLNNALAPLLTNNILGAQFIAQGLSRRVGKDYNLLLTYETTGTATLTSPFQVALFKSGSLESARASAAAFCLANPTYFFSTMTFQHIAEINDTEPFIVILFYTPDQAGGQDNWQYFSGGGSGGGVTIPVPVAQGGTGATTVGGAQSALSLVPGTDIATLVGGKVPSSQLPAIAITDTFVVASQAAMLALTAETGDVAVRTDISETFILQGTDPSVLGDWVQLETPTAAVSSVFGRTGAVSAQSGDYAASLINNDSAVAGATVKDALETLKSSAGVLSVTDVGHSLGAVGTGFVARMDQVTPNIYAKALGDTAAHIEVAGFGVVTGVDTYDIYPDGTYVTLSTASWDALTGGTGGLLVSDVGYLVSVVTAGSLSATPSTTPGTYNREVLLPASPTTALVRIGPATGVSNGDVTVPGDLNMFSGNINFNGTSGIQAQTWIGTIDVGADTFLLQDASSGRAFGALIEEVIGVGGKYLSKGIASGSAYLDFSQPAGHDNYAYVFVELQPSSDGSGFRAQVSDDGGSTFDSSGYQNTGRYFLAGGASGDQSSTSDGSIFLTAWNQGFDTNEVLSGIAWVTGSVSASRRTRLRFRTIYEDPSSALAAYHGNASRSNAATHDAIRFFYTTGTYSGVILQFALPSTGDFS